MNEAKRVRCNNVDYRKGYIEVRTNIHGGFINVETWDIHPDVDISRLDVKCDELPEGCVTANTELELSIYEAEQLIQLLQSAIEKARAQGSSNA